MKNSSFFRYFCFLFGFPFVTVMCFSADAAGLDLTSAAFDNGGNIPVRFTGQGEDVSPGLKWSGAPEGTKSFALIMDDPDAPMGTWVHWVIYDITAVSRGLEQDIPPDETLSDGSRQGVNSFRRIGYGGPNPPPGPAHRYIFTLYALDTELNLAPGAEKSEVVSAMKGHILAQAELKGMFKR